MKELFVILMARPSGSGSGGFDVFVPDPGVFDTLEEAKEYVKLHPGAVSIRTRVGKMVVRVEKHLFPKRVRGKTFHLCNYHCDGLSWDECSSLGEGCEIEKAIKWVNRGIKKALVKLGGKK